MNTKENTRNQQYTNMSDFVEQDKIGMDAAFEQAFISYKKTIIPVGACLINNLTHEVIGVGRNERILQKLPTFTWRNR